MTVCILSIMHKMMYNAQIRIMIFIHFNNANFLIIW